MAVAVALAVRRRLAKRPRLLLPLAAAAAVAKGALLLVRHQPSEEKQPNLLALLPLPSTWLVPALAVLPALLAPAAEVRRRAGLSRPCLS